jgi:hypothetical protein
MALANQTDASNKQLFDQLLEVLKARRRGAQLTRGTQIALSLTATPAKLNWQAVQGTSTDVVGNATTDDITLVAATGDPWMLMVNLTLNVILDNNQTITAEIYKGGVATGVKTTVTSQANASPMALTLLLAGSEAAASVYDVRVSGTVATIQFVSGVFGVVVEKAVVLL